MNAFDGIKARIGKYILGQNLKKHERRKQFHTFESARTVGILFDATDQQNYEAARNFAKFLTERKIRLYGLGYADTKEVSTFYSYYTGFNFYTKKDINWKGIPSNHNVNDFINEPLDILIDLSLAENFSLAYIQALSKASFKIGMFGKNDKRYDFMIDIKSNPTAEFLADQVRHFLHMFQPKKQVV
jgi:hypothetical protein